MNRAESLQQISSSRNAWDLIVVGGGATGLGTAVESAARGYRTLLLEQSDFAKGTSSRSTKLIHGGFRYLKQWNFALVSESLQERARLFANAPHLVQARPFVLPTFTRWESIYYWSGLKLYDWLAGQNGVPSSRWCSRQEMGRVLPNFRAQAARGGIQFCDGQFDDARLAIALAQTLADLGGTPVNYMPVISLLKSRQRIRGVVARDLESGHEYEISARAVVNATGAFADGVRQMDEKQKAPLVTVSQGAHIVLDRGFFPGDQALLIPKTDDDRVIFIIPWQNHVIVGTTETAIARPDLEPRPTELEVDFLLEHAARYLESSPKRGDILSLFAGLRPLARQEESQNTAALSREHYIGVSASGLISIVGGKWTTYRKMGEDAVNEAVKWARLPWRASTTGDLRLHGFTREQLFRHPHWQNYGSDAPALDDLIRENADWEAPLHSRLPYRLAEVVWAVRREMARTVEDVLARRTRALFLNAAATREAAEKVAVLMQEELGKDSTWLHDQRQAFEKLARQYSVSL